MDALKVALLAAGAIVATFLFVKLHDRTDDGGVQLLGVTVLGQQAGSTVATDSAAVGGSAVQSDAGTTTGAATASAEPSVTIGDVSQVDPVPDATQNANGVAS